MSYNTKKIINPELDEGKEQRSGLVIYQKIRDLTSYLYITFVKYPKSEKFSLVSDYKRTLFDFIGLIITAQKKYYKKTTLQDADVKLETLRIFNDLSYDLHCIDIKKYENISKMLDEIGRLLGGWIKKQKEKPT